MLEYDVGSQAFVGPGGSLPVPSDDEVSRKLAMLIEGECGELGPSQAAAKFGLSRQRYFQLRSAFHQNGALGLMSQKRGPKTNYRRTEELVNQAIRHRFLDPDASSDVIAQKLRQCGFKISKRSVDRIFEEFGLQKKTLQMQARSEPG
jgi:transposase